MSIRSRIVDAVKMLLNRYEAASFSSPDRGWVPSFVRDARQDANSWSRYEMFRKIVYFDKNSWLAGRIHDEHVKWTVGPNGLQVIPHTSDSEWNKAIQESYLEWCESPFLDSTLTMAQGHRLLSGSEHFHGELFTNYTNLKLRGKPSKPAIQFIESPRCSSPGQEYATREEVDGIVDGVQLGKDSNGYFVKPIGYHIRDTFEGDKWSFRGIEDMLHVFDPNRIGMYRCVTPYHAVLNSLQDVHELDVLGMQRAKQIAEISYWLSTASGELDPDKQRLSRYGTAGATPGTGETYDQWMKRMEMYRKSSGAKVFGIKTNEKVTQFANESPSVTEQWYLVYKMGQITAASNVPLLLIFPELVEKVQGTAVRGIYDNAHEHFRGKSFIYAHAARRNYRFFADWARYNDPRCVDAPADWQKCEVILPRAVNADVGHNSAAMLAEYAAGTRSLDDIAGAQGTTAGVLIRKKANNIADIKIAAQEISKERGVEVKPEEIAGNLAVIAQQLAQAEATEAASEQASKQQEEA